MERLVINHWTYYSQTHTTSPFGGVMVDNTLFKLDNKGNRITFTPNEWNYELTLLMTSEQCGKSFDMIYVDPFVDYR